MSAVVESRIHLPLVADGAKTSILLRDFALQHELAVLLALLPPTLEHIAGGSFRELAVAVMLVIEPFAFVDVCLLYTSPSPRDGLLSRMPSSA